MPDLSDLFSRNGFFSNLGKKRAPVVTPEQMELLAEFKQLSVDFFSALVEHKIPMNKLLISEDSKTKIYEIASQVASLAIDELPIRDRLNVQGFQEFVNLLQSNLSEYETLSSDGVLAVPCSLNFEITKQADNEFLINLSNSPMSIDQAFLDCFAIHDIAAAELKEEMSLDASTRGIKL